MKMLTLNNLKELPYAAEEALNRLRVNLGFCGSQFKKIVITSTTPNEGKSFVSSNLWRMLAEAGHKVVLVDADIRKSVLRSRYQISHKRDEEFVGIVHYLAGQGSVDDLIYATNVSENAFMVPTTTTVSNPALLFQSKRFPQLLDELAERFDYVLVDTAPLSNVADAGLIASQCDGTILVVRSGVTPRRMIASSIKQVERSGCELLGVVLNRVEARSNPYYYKYSKYGYYQDYYGHDDDHSGGSRAGGKRGQKR